MISFFTNVLNLINKKVKNIINLHSYKNKFNKINFAININKIVIFMSGTIILLVLYFNPKYIYYISTNFRQAETSYSIAKASLSLFSIFNSKNYKVEDIVINEENNKNDNIENVKEYHSEYEILDDMCKIEDELSVFNSVEATNITENTSSIQRAFVGNLSIINYSYNKDIDYSKLISDSNIILTKKSDKILLYNTHTSESYANSEKFTFEYTGTRRTTDANYNMLRITKELNNNLNEKGFNSIQDTTPHDYGTYTSAYAKSRITLQNAISSYGGFGLAIDVHRDAIENLDFRPTVNIRGVEVARIMLVIGAGSRDNKNPYFEDNLKLALKLQYIGEKIYPGLFRTMYIRNSIYNQDLNRYSLLIEVGASGNSIEEAQMATRCITNLLNIIYKD